MDEVKDFLLKNIVWIIIALVILILMISVFSSRKRIVKIYDKYLTINLKSGLTGVVFVQYLIRTLNLPIRLAKAPGKYNDAYVSKAKAICLSEDVLSSSSVASVAIIAHEMGHALQDSTKDAKFNFNHAMRKITRFTNKFIFPLLIAALCFWIFKWPTDIAWITTLSVDGGLLLLHIISNFSFIPIERDASRRGLALLKEHANLTNSEFRHCQKLLRVAGQTYIAHFFDDFLLFSTIKKYLYKTYS